MGRAGAKDDSKGLDKLFKLTVLGSVLIVVVYSVYYYSNAYKQTSSNIYYAYEQADIEVENLDFDTKVGLENIILTDNQNWALTNGVEGWELSAKDKEQFSVNERTTVALSGLVSEGFSELFMNELIKKFQNVPPVLMDNQEGVTVKSIQFEHYIFPYHAMVNWRDKSKPYKTFSFYTDSMPGDLLVGDNGFTWSSKQHGEYLKVLLCNANDSLSYLKNALPTKGNIELVEMPMVDFDLIFKAEEHIGKTFVNKGTESLVTESNGEIKILVGPSLKQNNIYEISKEGKRLLEIKPPFFIELGKEDTGKPYFYALITNEKLLIH